MISKPSGTDAGSGTSTSERTKGYLVKGATGTPARTLAQLALHLAEEEN